MHCYIQDVQYKAHESVVLASYACGKKAMIYTKGEELILMKDTTVITGSLVLLETGKI